MRRAMIPTTGIPNRPGATSSLGRGWWHRDIRAPERQLAVAVLQDAIECYQKRFGTRDGDFAEAEAWIFADERDYVFSFSNICGLLDLNPQCVRRALLTWRDQRVRGGQITPGDPAEKRGHRAAQAAGPRPGRVPPHG